MTSPPRPDPLAEIKERMTLGVWYDDSCYEPLEWLVGEVERLRDLLGHRGAS